MNIYYLYSLITVLILVFGISIISIPYVEKYLSDKEEPEKLKLDKLGFLLIPIHFIHDILYILLFGITGTISPSV